MWKADEHMGITSAVAEHPAPAAKRSRHPRVFLSFLPEDAAIAEVVAHELRKRHVKCWAVPAPANFSEAQLPSDIAHELTSSTCLIRICSAATQRNTLMQMELQAFRALQAKGAHDGAPARRILIELIADPAYTPDAPGATDENTQGSAPLAPAQTVTFHITNQPASAWMIGVLNAMGTLRARWEMSQGQILAVVIVGIACFMAVAIWMSFYYVAHFGQLLILP